MCQHPLDYFQFCPHCGNATFVVKDEKSKHCSSCGFVYYLNPSAAVACFVTDDSGRYLFVRRAQEPQKGTLDMAGGFCDLNEDVEQAVRRELKEETGLDANDIKFLFSVPNRYLFSGFQVPTMDFVFLVHVDDLSKAIPADDASEVIILDAAAVCPEKFGLKAIRTSVERYFELTVDK